MAQQPPARQPRSARPKRLAGLRQALAENRSSRLASGWLRRSWTSLLLVVLVVAVGFAALLNPGVEATDLKLNEGAVYVQNQSRSMVGTLNYQIDEIADATTVGDTESALLQEGRTVLVNNAGSSTLQSYDPATNALSSPVTPPANAQLSLNAGILAVTNPENGKVWFGPVDILSRSDFSGKANLDVLDWGKAIVTTSGNVIGLNVQDSTIVRPDGSVVEIPFQVDNQAPTAELSAVGEKAVVLDKVSQQIWVEGERQAVTISSGTSALLAPPTADASAAGRGGSAIYATQAGLNTIAGGAPQSLSGSMGASPTRPVVVGDCAYGAFTDRVVKVCDGENPEVQEIPELPDAAQLAFQTNRGAVVLQDLSSGRIWLVDKGMKIVDDWERVTPPDVTSNEDPNPPDERTTLPDRNQPNRPPVAQDDPNLGARVGRSTTLPILDNDSDEDGDLITVVDVTPVEGASLEFTGNGAGLQITLPEDAKGTYSFTYTISDGRMGTAQAVATVHALPPDQAVSNEKPVNIRPGETLIMSSGATVSKRVLVTWRDPDGDDLVLVNAMPETAESEDEVTFTTDGTITFRDVGKTTGPKKVRVWVSDGASTVEGFVLIDVRGREAAPPIANGDFVSTVVNREIVVNPLANDEGNNLILTEVQGSTEQYTVAPNYPEGTFRFRATTPGTYYLVYKVSNGPVSAGLVRVDVRAESNENNAPVAVRDTALVPFGGSVVIDPLLNDTDADNDVLVVQSISQHPAIKVIMTERHLLTISMVRHTETPVPLTYWVSDGRNSTRGTIVVFPAPEAGSQAPRAVNDHVKVRAGATVSVPVLANDISPVGLDLSLVGLPDNPMADRAWIDRDKVRIAIPETTAATTMTLTYQIADAAGRLDSATITIIVISSDAQNEAPIPQLVEARVLSNSITRIPIKLNGVDPNGDSVRLLGLGSGPALGRVVEIGDGWIRYEAYPDSRGTDTFRYQVIDSLGAIGTGEIRIGVAPPSDDNAAPIGVPDEISVRPGRSLMLPVLLNDYDIDGDQFGFYTDVPIEMDFPAEIVDDQFISLTAPTEPGDYLGKYYLIDKRGSTGDGSIYLNVSPDAPLLAPTALDDQLAVRDIIDQEWVEVDVQANDFDIDGPREELVLSLPESVDATAEAAVVDGKLSIKVADSMQQVRYTITDADGLSAQALVLVPGRNDSVPVLRDPLAVHTVEAGKVFTITFDTMVLGTQQRLVRLTSPETVRATKGTASIRPEGIDFTADVTYAGPASVVFEVIDQADPNDTTAKRAFITVPITVTPAASNQGGGGGGVQQSNRAPDGPAVVNLEVGAGEPDQQFPLRGRYSDPEGDNFSFQSWTLVSGDPGITWSASVGGDVIIARGGLTNKGAHASLSGRVVDSFGASRDITVNITVIGSTRPLPVAQPDVVADANAGQQRSVPVTANDRSYLIDDTSLTLLSAAVVSGAGTATVQGDSVNVTPERDFVGPMTVRYTIVDATHDPDRQVDGAIQLTVRSRPSRPGTPTIENEGNREVTIKWTSNDPNGMPVIERTVTATGNNGTSVSYSGCATNTCTIPGLTNTVKYTFTVTESNELGASDPSPASAEAMPDVKPPQMSAPTLVFPGRDMPGRLNLIWSPPVFDGSPVTHYTITEASGLVPDVTVTAPASSHEFTGLTNYQNYSFTITATNPVGTSDVSGASNHEHPSAPPELAVNPVAADTDAPDGSQLWSEWVLPVQGPDARKVFVKATRLDGWATEVEVAADATAHMFTGLSKGTYHVTVRIETRGGESVSADSEKVTTTANPQSSATGTLTATGANELTFALTKLEGDDWDYATVQFLLGDTEVSSPVRVDVGGTTTFAATYYQMGYTVRTRAYKQWSGGFKEGAVWHSTPVYAYGRPTMDNPTPINVVSDNVVELRPGEVSANGTDGQSFSYSFAGGAFLPYTKYDRLTVPTYGSSTQVTARVCDTAPGRENNCSENTITVSPPMTARVVGTTLTVTMNDFIRSGGNWKCEIVNATASAPLDGNMGGMSTKSWELPADFAGPYTVGCSAYGTLHSFKNFSAG